MLKQLIQAVFPNTCVCCREIIEEGEYFCDYCYSMLEQCAKDRLCYKCGSPKKECVCKYKVFYFDSVAAPYYNDKTARKAMYAFKFNKKENIGRFFAEKMAITVKQVYYDIDFDIVTCVPMYVANKRKRGYNQSEIIAKELSDILKLPFEKDILYSKRKKKAQHKIPISKRFNNVKDTFYTKKNLNGETVLLVDDIKTSGATISECARILYKAGANRVYCITGLISKLEKGKKDGNRNRN